jgi:hypothetical protein
MNASYYRMTSPTVALMEEDGRRVADLLPKGSIIEARSEAFSGTELVAVLWSEKVVLMFAQDLRARAEPVNGSRKRQGQNLGCSLSSLRASGRRENGVILYPTSMARANGAVNEGRAKHSFA